MLAKAKKPRDVVRNAIVDIKYDGNRYQIHKSWVANAVSIIIFNRKGNIVTSQYPDIVNIVRDFESTNVILDTEIYPINLDGSPAEHKLLAKRVHKLNKAEAVQQCPVKLAVFDLLSLDGKSYLEQPQSVRMETLQKVVPKEYQTYVFGSDGDFTEASAYQTAIDLGFEGIMIKDGNMPYQSGKRSKGWLKHKPPRVSLDVVITSGKYGEGKRSGVFGTLGISVLDGDEYISVGSVGTGLSEAQLFLLTTNLKKNVDSYEGDTFHFLPRIVLEVSADLVSQDEQGNYGLRFPRVKRIREDKFPKDIDTLTTVMEMI